MSEIGKELYHIMQDRARYQVTKAIKTGALVRQDCERCDSCLTLAHHEDYAKPLEVMWLCQYHHLERHRELDKEGKVLWQGLIDYKVKLHHK